MKKGIIFIYTALLLTLSVQAQPKVYINFVSHNEPGDDLHQLSEFTPMVTKTLQFAALVDSYGAKWNLQTCDGFAKGALDFQGQASNVFRTLMSGTYADNMEIDPRNKQTIYAEIADLYHIIDSLGGNPTTTLGGFLYFTNNATPEDWFQYEDTITGGDFPWVKWKCNLIWGAGSMFPPHVNDLNDYGVWMPDTIDDFYTHNSSRSLWYIGNGCQPLYSLDSAEDETVVISLIRGIVDSIQYNLWPQDKFYNYSITINQSQFGPTLFTKLTRVMDSVNAMGTSKIEWKTLNEKFIEFGNWQIATSNEYSQWNCGETWNSIKENETENFISVFPNPFDETISIKFNDEESHAVSVMNLLGEIVFSKNIKNNFKINTSGFSGGVYLIVADGIMAGKVVKE